MKESQTMPGTPPRGFLGWLRSLFGRSRTATPTPPPMPPPEIEIHEQQRFSFQTPAWGDAFEFSVSVACDWCGKGRHPEAEIRAAIAMRRELVPELLEAEVRPIARRFPPHQAAEAELAINATLGAEQSTRWCFDNGLLRCTPRVRVALEEAVREHRRDSWLQLMTMDGEFERAEIRVARLRRLVALWRELLADLERDRLAPHTARLAMRPDDFADAVRQLVRERRDEAERLLHIADQTKGAYQQLGVYESVLTYESGLRLLLDHLGVQVPGAPADGMPSPEAANPGVDNGDGRRAG